MLKPEVKQCLDKVMYQLDLCKNTLGLLEKRISTSESNLQSVMEFIRTEDINYVSNYLKVQTHDSKANPLLHPYRDHIWPMLSLKSVTPQRNQRHCTSIWFRNTVL